MSFDEKIAQWRKKLSYQTGSLALVGLLTSAALTLTNQATEASIEAGLQKDLKDSLSQVLPAGSFDNDLATSTIQRPGPEGKRTVYIAKKSGQISGVVFETKGIGYGGEIQIVMGISLDGKILGVRVLSHKETPGLGDKIEVEKADWIKSFVGKALSTAKWGVKKDGGEFDQFTGATITPRAVVKAVHEGLQWYTTEQAAIVKGAS